MIIMNGKNYNIMIWIAVITILMGSFIQQSNCQGSLTTSEQNFRNQVEKLKDLGFKNGKRNKKLIDLVNILVSTDGNVYKALQRLHF